MEHLQNRLTKFNRITFLLMAVLLSLGTTSAHAGKVLDKVNEVNNRVKTVVSNTNGLQNVVSNVRDMRDGFRDGVITDIRETLQEAQDLAEFIRERRESAGNSSQYPDVAVLVSSLDNIASIIKDDGSGGGALEALAALLEVLPERMLAPLARRVSRVGVDSAFVERLNQMSLDLVELRDFTKEVDAQQARSQAVAMQGLQLTAVFEPIRILERCAVNDADRQLRISRIAKTIKGTALALKYFGALTEALGGTIETGKVVQIWGWAGIDITADPSKTTGKLMMILADGILALVGKAQSNLATCDSQARHAELMVEICTLTRFRSATCQAYQ